MSYDDRPNESSRQDGSDGNGAASAGDSKPQRQKTKTTQALTQFSSGLSKPFIQRPVMTMLLTASLIVFGILTFRQLPVNDLPAVDYPIIQVTANYPGANPETMANTVATPLEKQFTQIPGLTFSTSSSTQGSTNITLQFELDKSVDAAATDVQAAIQRASGQLPNDLPQPPQFQKSNPNDQPVMYIALTSDTLTDGDLYKYATSQVQQRINILPGVSQVQIYGVKSAIRVKVDPGALASRNITFDELATAVRAGTSYAGAGQLDGKNTSFVLRPNGQVDNAEGYRNMIIARGKDGSPVFLRDVADCRRLGAGRASLAAFLRARISLAGLRRCPRRLPAGGRERGRSGALNQQFASANAAGIAGFNQARPDLRSFAEHREFSR